jgi:phospholipid/cholesterol/gamma-HCH transport system ATP-binding protein
LIGRARVPKRDPGHGTRLAGNGRVQRGASPSTSVYELRGVWKRLDEVDVLRGINLELLRGETLGIIGPSGSGKTVLLKCMVALLAIDEGTLRFEGQSVPDMSPEQQDHLRQRVGLVFQAGGLFDSLSVRENLEYGLHEHFFRTLGEDEVRQRVLWALDAVGLSPSEADTMPADLSGGMRKRVGIARTIITHPEVLLYDEPTQGLDPPNAHRISNLIIELRHQLQLTSVIVSHDLRTVFTVCDRVGFLDQGRLLETGKPAELTESTNPNVRDFILGHPPEEPFDPRESQPPEPWK